MSYKPKTMLTVLIYDISDNSKRTRVYKLLKRYAAPIQKSAFEGRLSRREREAIMRLVGRNMDAESDRFVMYTIGSDQEKSIKVIGTPRPQHPAQGFFII